MLAKVGLALRVAFTRLPGSVPSIKFKFETVPIKAPSSYIPIVCSGVPTPETSPQKTPIASVNKTCPRVPLFLNLSRRGPSR